MRDTDRVETFLKEFREYEKDGTLPAVHRHEPGRGPHHGHDARHLHARRPASPATTWRWAGSSRRSRKSKFWPEMAIFVIEDDAQNGPDHVDAHRTVGLVISPYTKRHHLDSTQYSTVSMIRTMELILGLPPLEPVRRRRATRCSTRFTDKADLDALHPAAGADRPRTPGTRSWPTGPSGRARWTSPSTTRSTTSS